MAKKTPPTPPPDDFDPERELGEEIVPIDDDLVIDEVAEDPIVEVEADDLFGNVVADDGEGATQLGHGGDADALPEVVVEADEALVEEADDDLFANVVADDGDQATKLGHGAGDQPLPEIEVDETVAEVEDDVLDADEAIVATDDEELSPHETKTVGSMSALENDDPFAGVGDDAGLVPAGVGGDGGEDEPYYEEEAPKPKTHWFAWTLIGLNIVASLAAPYLLALDYQKRQQYTYGVLRLDLAMLGLPTEEEEVALPAARVTLPGYRISADEMKRIVAARVGAMGDKFEGFDGQIITRVPPSMLDKDILKEHFAELYIDSGDPINTVEKEIKRIEKALVGDIETAARAGFDALPSDAAKRDKIEKMLHPLAMDTYQSEKLAKTIKNAQGADLEKLFMEAAQRRMAFDFLLPLELFRPGDIAKGLFVEKFGDIEALPLDKVLERVTERVKSTYGPKYQSDIHLGEEWGKIERDTIEKRLTITFTMLSLAHVKKPDGELLFPYLMDRIPLVMGQYDFALACELFPSRLMQINELVLDRIRIDREGFEVSDKAGALVRGKAFIDFYEDELQRIRFLQNDIFKAKIRLADLQDQLKRDTDLLEKRKEQRDDVLKRIASARAKTAKDIAELRGYQNELFRFQTVLATSEEELTRVYDDIREKRGGEKAAPKKEVKQP